MAIDRCKKELKAPDSYYLTSLQTELSDLYLQQDNDIDLVREQREMRRPALSEADKDYMLVHVDPRDPDITEEAFQQTAILTLERPKLSIVGGEGDTAQTVASKLEHFTEETLWECGTREPGSDTMTQVTDATSQRWRRLGQAPVGVRPVVRTLRHRLDPSKTRVDDQRTTPTTTSSPKRRRSAPVRRSSGSTSTRGACTRSGRTATCARCSRSREMPKRSAFRRYRLARDSQGNIVPEELGQ